MEPIIAESTTKPTIESSETPTITSTNLPAFCVLGAPSTAKTKSTQKSVTIPESRIWHWQLAPLNPTTRKSLIDGYTHNDSMCTVCIQAKHKQRYIRVPLKHTTRPFKLVNSDVCGPFSTPTLGDNQYYILFIDNYTRFTTVWLLPN